MIEKQVTYSIGPTKLYTPIEAAKELNINASLVRRYCRQGRLGTRFNGVWLINESELERFKAIPRKVGNPEFGKRE